MPSWRPCAGSWDPPGARLLDVVAVMDRLRSPGGCPWDAEQTHQTLAPYLLEEAYELIEAIELDDLAHLREELGDVLLQVAFHSRLAEERQAPERFSIDDVAADLVAKLIRRHPHVFAGREVASAAEVAANWEAIKAAEKRRGSVTDGVPLGQPAWRSRPSCSDARRRPAWTPAAGRRRPRRAAVRAGRRGGGRRGGSGGGVAGHRARLPGRRPRCRGRARGRRLSRGSRRVRAAHGRHPEQGRAGQQRWRAGS